MADPGTLLVDFYEAFARRDAVAMAACYHPEATFEDPAFGPLDRAATCAMWEMLLARAADLAITHHLGPVDAGSGTVQWEARYTFTRTGRSVVNRITATFTFQDGLIRTHRDSFDAWVWSRQAFGPLGLLLGWTSWFQNRVRSEALRALRKHQARTHQA